MIKVKNLAVGPPPIGQFFMRPQMEQFRGQDHGAAKSSQEHAVTYLAAP
jgi:hypothetical protein